MRQGVSPMLVAYCKTNGDIPCGKECPRCLRLINQKIREHEKIAPLPLPFRAPSVRPNERQRTDACCASLNYCAV